MRVLSILSALLVSSMMLSQTQKTSTTPKKDSVVIDWNKEKYVLSQRKIDSLSALMMSRFSTMISDKQNQAEFKSSINQLEGMLYKTLDILLDDKTQLKKAKSEMHQAFQEVNPKIDSAFILLQNSLQKWNDDSKDAQK